MSFFSFFLFVFLFYFYNCKWEVKIFVYTDLFKQTERIVWGSGLWWALMLSPPFLKLHPHPFSQWFYIFLKKLKEKKNYKQANWQFSTGSGATLFRCYIYLLLPFFFWCNCAQLVAVTQEFALHQLRLQTPHPLLNMERFALFLLLQKSKNKY